MKTAPLFICAVTRRSGRLGSIENIYSQCENALEQFLFEIALADAGADARRRGANAASTVARRACPNR